MGKILLRIQEIASAEGITIGALERQIGASKGVLSRAINNGTDIQSKWIQTIVENYPRYSSRWLLTGRGDMLADPAEPAHSAPENSPEGIPLIPLSAMDGAFTGETSVMDYECERYVIPAFKGADFLIQVKGDSMRPPLIIRATSWPASVSPCQTCFSNGIKYMSSIPTKGHSSNVSNPEATESIF